MAQHHTYTYENVQHILACSRIVPKMHQPQRMMMVMGISSLCVSHCFSESISFEDMCSCCAKAKLLEASFICTCWCCPSDDHAGAYEKIHLVVQQCCNVGAEGLERAHAQSLSRWVGQARQHVSEHPGLGLP